jgi:hypothetical protein
MLSNIEQPRSYKVRKERVAKVFNFIIKTAMTVLPPKQRRIFYSVWVRSEGKPSKGIMDLSRKTNSSHFTLYNNYYKSFNSIKNYLIKTGIEEQIIKYLKGSDHDDNGSLDEYFG